MNDEEYDINESPLANRMKPQTLDEICGQEHILGKNKLLRRMIEADKLRSIILWGPPGTGKTSIANVIAHITGCNFMQVNATTSGKKDMEEVIEAAKKYQYSYGGKTILFVDEIHRFSKAQQDFLLSYVEKGTIILIGATTENPSFEVINALISRSTVFELQGLSPDDIEKLIKRALSDRVRGIRNPNITMDSEAIKYLATMANGDCRCALNALELAAETTEPTDDGKILISIEDIQNCIQKRTIRYDKNGQNHYDTISAFIKSIRNSDPDAAVYYLALMIEAGEDPLFIARRLVIAASEDIGMADPMASVIATNALLSLKQIGMPEGTLILSNATIYLATAKKSNSSTIAIGAATDAIHKINIKQIPPYLQDAHYAASKASGYLYPHNFPHHIAKQECLPSELFGNEFYIPTDNGYEKKVGEYMKIVKDIKKIE